VLQPFRNRALHDVRGGLRQTFDGPLLELADDGHYRYGGNPIIPRGVCFGAETYYRPGDCAIAKAMGANIVRFVTRAWAPPSNDFKGDAYDPSSPITGFLNIQYFNLICAGIIEAKSLGMIVRLAFDSDCGQAERTDPVCQINGSPSTFFLPSGAQRLLNHINAIRAYCRTLPGYIDQIEPLVEPHPSVTWPYGLGQAYDERDVRLLQEQLMQAALAEAPWMQFLIGGLSYFRNRLGFPSQMALPEWIARKNVAFTCDMLDNAVCDTYANVAAVVQTFVDFRSAYRRPVDPQQWGTRSTDDPTYSYEDQYVGLMAAPPGGGGSFGGTKWEFVGGPGQNYAPYSQHSATDEGVRTVDQARITSMQNGFALPCLYA
jgi:hypothetical protein